MAGKISPSRPNQGVITRTVIWAVVLGYALFLVGGSTYENYRMNEEIKTAQLKIAEHEKRKRLLELSLVYYRSNAFKEIEARRRLGLKAAGERVVALPEASTEPVLSVALTSKTVSAESAAKLPPYRAWWNLFFGSSS